MFASRRGHYSAGPRLTLVSWKRWRRQWRTSATTWTLPRAWTPTKTRSITLQTEWPRLFDLLPQKCPLPPVSGSVALHKPGCPPQSFFFLIFFFLNLQPHPPGLTSPSSIKSWDACNLPPSPALCKMFDSVCQGCCAFLLLTVHSNNLHKDAPFEQIFWRSMTFLFFKCLFLNL